MVVAAAAGVCVCWGCPFFLLLFFFSFFFFFFSFDSISSVLAVTLWKKVSNRINRVGR